MINLLTVSQLSWNDKCMVVVVQVFVGLLTNISV